MLDRNGIFAGDNPFEIANTWLSEAKGSELNDPNAMSLATVDASGMPNVRVVLLKEIEDGAIVFYTNYNSAKSQELIGAGKAAIVLHWKSLRRQIRMRGLIEKEDGPQADAYFASRSVQSRLGAWASQQSEPLEDRATLEAALRSVTSTQGKDPKRPPNWGGFRLTPLEVEFWADGKHRLHDRFKWARADAKAEWVINRLNP